MRPPMSRRNVVQQGFDRFGSKAGFEKKSGSWYRRTPEVIAILNLQKSQYGPQYFLNLSFWLRELGDERYPKAHQSHVVARVSGLVPKVESRLKALLDLEYAVSDEVRIFELVAVLSDNVLPIVERAKDVDGLRSLVADGTFDAALVVVEAHSRLGVSY